MTQSGLISDGEASRKNGHLNTASIVGALPPSSARCGPEKAVVLSCLLPQVEQR